MRKVIKEKVVSRRTASVALCSDASPLQVMSPGWSLGKWRCHRQPQINQKSGQIKPKNVATPWQWWLRRQPEGFGTHCQPLPSCDTNH
jgi:hypothetical protein